MNSEQKYELSGISIVELNKEIDSLWKELQDKKSGVYQDALSTGIPEVELNKLLQHERTEVLEVNQEGSTLDPITTGILIAIGTAVGEKIATDIWTYLILPKLKRTFGEESLKEDNTENKQISE